MSGIDRLLERPLFSSVRERRLWGWALLVVVAIYSTLGLTATLLEVVGTRRFFEQFFVAGFGVIWLAILTQGLRVRPRGIEIGVGLGIVAVYLMVIARLGIPERTHLFEYGVVGVLMYEALTERAGQGRLVRVPALVAVVATSVVGVLDECIQLFLPKRVFDPVDMLFNAFAAAMAVTACAALGWVRRRVRRAVRP